MPHKGPDAGIDDGHIQAKAEDPPIQGADGAGAAGHQKAYVQQEDAQEAFEHVEEEGFHGLYARSRQEANDKAA